MSQMNLLETPFSFTQAIWTEPLTGEANAPDHRIIHQRVLNFPREVALHRLGIRLGQGYCKCGSGLQPDWIRDLRVLTRHGGEWEEVGYWKDLHRPEPEEVLWLPLELRTAALILQLRRSGIDEWWTGWNLAGSALVTEGEEPLSAPFQHSKLDVEVVALTSLPSGIQAKWLPGEVRYRSRFLEVGFNLGRPGFAYLSLDQEGLGRTQRNLLARKAGWKDALREYLTQGPVLSPLGAAEAAGFFAFGGTGSVRVSGASVEYELELAAGQQYRLRWMVREDGLSLHALRMATQDMHAWRSGAWQVAFDASVAQTTALGSLERCGRVGLLGTPLVLHAPGFGSLEVTANSSEVAWRADAVRPLFVTTGELKLGEIPLPEGDTLLKAGQFESTVEWRVLPVVKLPFEAPEAVSRAFAHCAHTAIPYRADTGTLANNGISIHVPLCADTWAALCTRITAIGSVRTLPLLRDSLVRWLEGAPGYGSGSAGGHRMGDEYLMTAVSCLLALARYLEASGDEDFLYQYQHQFTREWELLQALDMDGDGLIESPQRSGISGRHGWSTNWYDAISFGWKDAFSNALLYETLQKWQRLRDVPGVDFSGWMRRLRAAYLETFWSPENGWLGGWRCRENQLHDYGFLFVNGAAVNAGLLEPELARQAIEKLWNRLQAQRLDYRLGLPGNLLPIPESDLAAPQLGKPYGFFENGGLSHAQSHHFVRALGTVGMMDEADGLLFQLCEGLACPESFGGCGTDLEWRRPDGVPCGYEGLLVDQFGILAVAWDRFQD